MKEVPTKAVPRRLEAKRQGGVGARERERGMPSPGGPHGGVRGS